MMSIRYKIFGVFSIVIVLACGLAFYGIRGISSSGELVVRLYDGPLMGINHARSAHAALNQARLLTATGLGDSVSNETVTEFRGLLNEITGDLRVVRERIDNNDVMVALTAAE